MSHENYEAKVEEMFADHAGADAMQAHPLTSLEAMSTLQRVGFDLIQVECGNVDAIAEAVGAVLTRILKSIDIPIVPEFVEVQVESFVVAWVVSQIKSYGHAKCKPA